MVCSVLDDVHRLPAREADQLGGLEPNEMRRRPAARPYDGLRQQNALDQDTVDARERKRSDRSRREPGRFHDEIFAVMPFVWESSPR